MPELRLENSLVDERYEVHERLGLGSYAEIWVARDHLAGGREVVLKALNTSLQGTPDADLERTLIENFQNEAIALDTVRHPHVILRLGHGTAADLRGVPFHYLVLEYMSGGDLLRLCRRQPGSRLNLDQALFFFKQACEALAYAHSQGIIHRDLKPNNLLISAEQQTLKVADFGVAKLSSGEATEITRVGAGIYAPPEHHPDEVESNGKVERLTAAADIYSLAKSVYTVVCGRAPSQFACQTITSLPAEVRNEAWANSLLTVLKRATALNPKDRYATVTEFWSDLANVAVFSEENEEETQVRPRLSVSKFDVPTMPPQPDFEPVLASSGAQPKAIAVAEPLSPVVEPFAPSAAVPAPAHAKTPVSAPGPNGFGGKPKIVVDLQPAAPQPLSTSAQNGPAAAVKAPPQTPANKNGQQRATRFEVKDKFSEGRRSLLFGGLLAVAFLGFLLTLYHTVRNNGLPVGLGKPSRIEITIDKLNVRSGPSAQSSVLGVIPKGTRHRVLNETEHGWMQIEVEQWDESEPHTDNQKQGWVAGTARNVKVIGRRAW